MTADVQTTPIKTSPPRGALAAARADMSGAARWHLAISLFLSLFLVAFLLILFDLPVRFANEEIVDTALLGFWLAVAEIPFCLAAFLLFLPGRLYVAGRVAAGMETGAGDILYAFTSCRRFARSLALSFLAFCLFLLPAAVTVTSFGASVALFRFLVDVRSPFFFSLGTLAATFLVSCALSLVALYLYGFFAAFAALAVGNEQMPLSRAFMLAVTGKNTRKQFFFLHLRFLGGTFLSLFTLGIGYFFWVLPHFDLTYMRLVLTLYPKGEEL